MTGDPNLSSQAGICGDCGCLHEARLVVSETVPSSVLGLLSFVIHGMKAMSMESIPEVFVGALESILSSNNTLITELES